jgi:hypothetical protein
LRRECYGELNYKHQISQYIIDRLDLLGFLIWFLDDGNYNKQTHARCINCGAMDRQSIVSIVDHLNRQYNLSMTVTRLYPNTKCWSCYLYINAKSRDIVLPIWREFYKRYNFPECIHYKLI